jgi:hypothetical protein
MEIDHRYAWLRRQGALPKMVLVALDTYGLKETPGPGNCPVIMSWQAALVRAGKLKPGQYYADSVPWCGLGMGCWALTAGKPVVDDPLWALNWAKYGDPVAVNEGTIQTPDLQFAETRSASLGDITVFSRPVKDASGKVVSYAGHVALYIAEDPTHYHVLGCNQGDAVSIVRIEKSRCVAIRRPPFQTAMPDSARPYHVASAGALSTSEA